VRTRLHTIKGEAMKLRDPIAHGCSKSKRPLRAGEVLEAQSLAHAILVRAVKAVQEPKASVNGP